MTKDAKGVRQVLEHLGERFVMVEHRLIHQGMPEENGKNKEVSAALATLQEIMLGMLPEKPKTPNYGGAKSLGGAFKEGEAFGKSLTIDLIEQNIRGGFNNG